MIAITSDMSDGVEMLLDIGQDPYFVNSKGQTALSYACMASDEKTVRLLCSKMDTVEIPTQKIDSFSSIAKYAVHSKNIEILRMILEKGCDLNRYDYSNEVPADSIRGTIPDELGVQFIDLMVKNGFDINVRSDKTMTSFLDRLMQFASVGKYPKVCEYLLSHKAEVNFKFADGRTLLDKVKMWHKDRSLNRKMYFKIFSTYYPEIQK